MKEASVQDIWRDLQKKNNRPLYIKKFIFEDVKNIKSGEIEFSQGINAICGANGVGKSTLLQGIYLLLNSETGDSDSSMFTDSKLTVQIFNKGNVEEYKADNNTSTFVNPDDDLSIAYLSSSNSVDCIKRFRKEENLDDFFDNTEESYFSEEDLEAISYIVGKKYTECKAYQIEESIEYPSMPFFSVKTNNIEYDTRDMGVGEHSIIYTYFYIKSMEKSIILIEEPENFIPPFSQKCFTQILARKSVDNKLNIIFTTHSNHILNEIPNKYIHVVRINPQNSRIINNLSIGDEYLKPLGLKSSISGYILLEDHVARLFCKSIFRHLLPNYLNKYKFISVPGGASELSGILKGYNSEHYEFKIVGLLDGDMNNDAKRKELGVDDFKWQYSYLPSDKSAEILCREIIASDKSEIFCEKLNISMNVLIKVLSDIEWKENHDWLLELSRELGIGIEQIIDVFTLLLIQSDETECSIYKKFCLDICDILG